MARKTKAPLKPRVGRRPRVPGATIKGVSIKLTQEEHDLFTKAAGDTPLAQWIRDTCAAAARGR
jgi:hypothetical protein